MQKGPVADDKRLSKTLEPCIPNSHKTDITNITDNPPKNVAPIVSNGLFITIVNKSLKLPVVKRESITSDIITDMVTQHKNGIMARKLRSKDVEWLSEFLLKNKLYKK